MTEEDRTLLERAAKVAGLTDAEWSDTAIIGPAIYSETLWDEYGSGYWNPLLWDADAFRLAVKLGLVIEVRPHGTSVSDYGEDRQIAFERSTGDAQSACRRAIVRAAASMTKV